MKNRFNKMFGDPKRIVRQAKLKGRMKNTNLDKFIKASGKVSLSRQEKADIKRILEGYIDTSVRGVEQTRLQGQRSRKTTLIKTMPILLALMLTFTGGTALAASGALPGDLLYPVKVNFNEKVRGAMAVSNEAEAKFQADLAARRLEELEKLATSAEGDLETELRESIVARFEAHSEEALRLIEGLKAEGKAEAAAAASARLEASLEAHSELFERILERGDEVRDRLIGVAERIESRTRAAASARADALIRVGDSTSARLEVVAETRAKQADQALKTTKRVFDRYEARLSERVEAQVEAKIEAAESAYNNGVTALEAENYAEAFNQFQASITYSEHAQVMIRVWASLNIDLSLDRDQDDDSDDSDDSNTSNSDDEDSEGDANEDDDASLDLDANLDLRVGPSGAGASGNAGVGLGL